MITSVNSGMALERLSVIALFVVSSCKVPWSSKASSMYDASNSGTQEPPVQEAEAKSEAKDDKKIKDADFEVVED